MKKRLLSLLIAICMMSSLGMSGCMPLPLPKKSADDAASAIVENNETEDDAAEDADLQEGDAEESENVLTEEDYMLISPINDEQADKIAAMPKYSKDDTWAFYIYMIGSNLESCELDELSEFTNIMVGKDANEIHENIGKRRNEALRSFAKEVANKGVDLPKRLYNPVETKIDDEFYYVPETAEDDVEDEEDADSDEAEGEEEPMEKSGGYVQPTGMASNNLKQLLSASFNENMKVVIETGGAKRWEDSRINPNRSQRFLVDKDGFRKVHDTGVVNMGSKEELVDFLDFCTTNYSADHEVVFFWDHGTGVLGYGSDEIYGGSSISLHDMEEAFMEVTKKRDINDPHFEAIGFDACLMASLEVTDALRGFAKYLYASEEIEPGEGWDYAAIFNALYDDLEMNGAQLGKALADSFIKQSIDVMAPYGVVPAATFSITDLSKTSEVKDAYAEFAVDALRNTMNDKKALAEISRAAASSVSYGENLYDVFNAIDLGRFMEELPDSYDAHKNKVLDSISDAVLYSRNTTYMEGSRGLSVYFPQYVSAAGIMVAGLYFDGISDNMDINTLYYYKLAGCLNDKYTEYAKKAGCEEIPIIDYSIMEDFAGIPVDVKGDGNLGVKLDDELLSLSQSVGFGIAKYDKETNDIVYYGDDVYASLDENGEISTFFDGKWITYGGVPLELEIISSNPDTAILKSKIIYNGCEAYMLIAYDAVDMEAKLLGIGYKANEVTPDRNLMQPVEGDEILILKSAGNLYNNNSWCYYRTVNYDDSVKLEEKPLDDGMYFEYISLMDLRSDVYSSQIASFEVKDGKIINQKIEDELYQYYKD